MDGNKSSAPAESFQPEVATIKGKGSHVSGLHDSRDERNLSGCTRTERGAGGVHLLQYSYRTTPPCYSTRTVLVLVHCLTVCPTRCPSALICACAVPYRYEKIALICTVHCPARYEYTVLAAGFVF